MGVGVMAVGKAHQRIIREKKESEQDLQHTFLINPDNPCLYTSLVKEVDFKTASTIILDYEWIGTMPLPKSIRYMYGIYFDGVLGGVEIYVEPSTRQFFEKYPRRVVQLNRGAVTHWTPRNTASFMLGKTFDLLRKHNIIAIVAYCTKEAGEVGTIYQSCNFIYTGETSPSKSYYLDGHWISERTLADKKSWAKNKSERWVEKFKTLPTRELSGKYRYIYLLGTKRQNKDFLNQYGYNSLPYPKRDNVLTSTHDPL
jgi:hypothetical protein